MFGVHQWCQTRKLQKKHFAFFDTFLPGRQSQAWVLLLLSVSFACLSERNECIRAGAGWWWDEWKRRKMIFMQCCLSVAEFNTLMWSNTWVLNIFIPVHWGHRNFHTFLSSNSASQIVKSQTTDFSKNIIKQNLLHVALILRSSAKFDLQKSDQICKS